MRVNIQHVARTMTLISHVDGNTLPTDPTFHATCHIPSPLITTTQSTPSLVGAQQPAPESSSTSTTHARRSMTMTMTMTHSEKVNPHQSAAWPYWHGRRGHNPTKKESVEAVVPCALGKMCNWDTVDDSVNSHKKDRRKHRQLLRLI